jgi:Ankyrin repeats (3 copies)
MLGTRGGCLLREFTVRATFQVAPAVVHDFRLALLHRTETTSAAFVSGELDVADFLATEWPESVRAKSNDGRLPLHAAAQSGKLPVAQILVVKWPSSVREASNDGRLPLHIAALLGKLPVYQCLLQSFPESVQFKALDGRLPLHEECDGGDWDNAHDDPNLMATALCLCTSPWRKAHCAR